MNEKKSESNTGMDRKFSCKLCGTCSVNSGTAVDCEINLAMNPSSKWACGDCNIHATVSQSHLQRWN